MRDRLGEFLTQYDEYLDGKRSYEDLVRFEDHVARDIQRRPSGAIATSYRYTGTTVHTPQPKLTFMQRLKLWWAFTWYGGSDN